MTLYTAYAAQRFPARVFVPAIVLHAAAAWWATPSAECGVRGAECGIRSAECGLCFDLAERPWSAFGIALGLMTLLVVQFRLWDDLEDIERDGAAHPDRVLVNSCRKPFHVLLIALATATGALFATRGPALAGFALLYCAFWVAYRRVRPRIVDALWRYGILLLKYPAFVGLVALSLGRPVPARLATAVVAAYLGTSFYEAWHHDRLQGVAS